MLLTPEQRQKKRDYQREWCRNNQAWKERKRLREQNPEYKAKRNEHERQRRIKAKLLKQVTMITTQTSPSNHYFPIELDQVIDLYNSTEDANLRNKIWEERLHNPFSKLVECVLNRFRAAWNKVVDGEDYVTLHNMAMTKLSLSIGKYNSSKGHAFGYFSTVIKYYYMALSKQLTVDYRKHSSLDALDPSDDQPHTPIKELSYTDKPDLDYSEYYKLFIDFLKSSPEKVCVNYKHYPEAYNTIVNVMSDVSGLDSAISLIRDNQTNKGKHLFFNALREKTSTTYPKLRLILTRIKNSHAKQFSWYKDHGTLCPL